MSSWAEVFRETGFHLLRRASVRLPSDVKKRLRKAYGEETSPTGKTQLKNILDNIEAAERLGRPICQDTGLISFYVKTRKPSLLPELRRALEKASAEATAQLPLRPNAVHPLTRKNSGNNLGKRIPHIEWVFNDSDWVELTVVLKGAGSENMSAFAVLSPSEGEKGVEKFVVNRVVEAGGRPCPPTVLCVGIGGTGDLAFKLAKLALLRPLGSRNPDEAVSKLENRLVKLANRTGIGPMGLGGKFTVLDAKVEHAHCHTANLPVALNFQCWADRRATARIHSDRSVEILE
ncbi:fumarate hydratase [Candidatus Hecatella orcuttiae]|jgi:fumarate hydratase subunit alpha|uniref:fumarate hydratase n=1 Tax=Candidatus Hecatella orcuttiae TaxID=1935119 RepID=UPI002867E336|nr:fumarate hydratase [Candidatus Hecatella orcuttiae]